MFLNQRAIVTIHNIVHPAPERRSPLLSVPAIRIFEPDRHPKLFEDTNGFGPCCDWMVGRTENVGVRFPVEKIGKPPLEFANGGREDGGHCWCGELGGRGDYGTFGA
jgi:hypothetical protein